MAHTEKQKRFIAEYLIDLNATQAAMRAGYSARTANEQGCQLLAKLSIKEALKSAMHQRQERTEITQDRVLAEYAKLAFLDPRRFYNDKGGLIPVPDLPAEVAAALSGMEIRSERGGDGEAPADVTKIKFADKKAALDSVARHLGMFIDKVEHSGNVIVVASPLDERL